MCGIAGVVYADAGRPVDARLLPAMGRALAHRGPDGEGFWSELGVGLVHRRLAIIDLVGGAQPLGNEDGSVQVVFNGEIYNYQDLRQDLLRRGHVFRTDSDTEVLVHLYEEVGDDLVSRLRGMFAFALWDNRRRRLLLARDRVGVKPLYVFRDHEKILFSSELKPLLAHPAVPRKLDPAALEDFLTYGMVPGPRCIFRGFEKVQPGHILAVTPSTLDAAPRRYWRLQFEPDERPTADEWAERVRAKVEEAVRLHLIADVPVGAFLSGGIDSSVVVAATAGQTNGPMRTFSIGFKDEAFSELPFARRVAAQFGTAHIEEVVTPDAVSLLDDLTHSYDEPFADSSALPTFLVSRLAARHVKVALSGDGGDEAFGGYSRYAHDLKEASLRRRLPGWLRRWLGPVAGVWPKADWLPRPLRAKTLLTNLSLDPAAAYANTLAVCRPPQRRRLMNPEVAAELNGHEPEAVVRFGYGATPDALSGMLAADVAVMLPDDYLVKVDRASMANGLEVRPPLLDHELLELAARIPPRFKVCENDTKWILKMAFQETLPSDILRRPKRGFELPIDGWLRGPLAGLVEDKVLSPRGRLADLINVAEAGVLARQHRSGLGRHGGTLWGLLVLASWAERYLN